MTSVAGTLFVYGANFSFNSVIEVNGTPLTTSYQSTTELWGFPSPNGNELGAPGVYSITVNDSASHSNAVTVTVYSPKQGPQPFVALPAYSTGPQEIPTPIAMADVNGDGLADLIIGTTGGTSNIAVLLGQSNGTLGAPSFLPGGALSLAAGDLNGDGFADIVAGNFPAVGTNNATASSITVLLSDGSGNFTTGTTQTFTGTYPGPMVLADIMGTGRNDLLVASVSPSVLYLFPNQGNGTFGTPVNIATLGSDRWFAVADFNGDGTLDIAYSGLVSAGSAKENTHILLNQGDGTFNDIVPTAMADVGGIVVAGDFNNDGLPDLAVEVDTGSGPVTLQTFLNAGSNSFTQGSSISLGPVGSTPYRFVIGDFDNDGFLDIAGANGSGLPGNMLMLWGNGAGDFTSQQIIGPEGLNLASGDINGDGIPDIVVPDGVVAATVVLGQTGRTYPQPESIYPQFAAEMSIGDVNGDGAPDLFFSGDPANNIPSSVFLNDGHGNFTLAGSPSASGTTVADLTGSGKADLIGVLGSTVTIWPGTGDPNYPSTPIVISVPTNFGGFSGSLTADPLIADLNGDGLPELIGENGIAWNEGNYQFNFAPLNMNGVFAVADVNNDGRPDLITANGTFLNQGNGQFTQIAMNGLPIQSGDMAAVGDFNGDGKLDIAFISPLDTVTVVVAYGNGDGTFYVQSELGLAGNPVGIVAADFNGDGLADILTPIELGSVLLYTNNGQGQFSTSWFSIGEGAVLIAVSDFNMDGKPDVVILDQADVSPSNALIVFNQ